MQRIYRNQNMGKTHCKRGHEFTPENTYVYKGHRTCKKCQGMWFKDNVQRVNLIKSAWSKKNPEKVKEAACKWYNNNTDLAIQRNRVCRKNKPEVYKAAKARRRAKVKGSGGSFSAAEWILLCTLYNNKCLCCKRKEILEADHIVPVSKGGTSNIENIQPLCRSCNARKRAKTIDYRNQPESPAIVQGNE